MGAAQNPLHSYPLLNLAGWRRRWPFASPFAVAQGFGSGGAAPHRLIPGPPGGAPVRFGRGLGLPWRIGRTLNLTAG